ncbi:hypothetical protein E1263_15385 [Kribbella antibiotica]|uniref:DUF3558 domain-containing protein n=1 Tax=Kribbella antibiotica TaxID=190195 RepID=A0A4R4ZM43_9ACTN|nr:hypothetical protein [Kribbella antibiotica]TDD59300.1 hypothetical protein E1263_15385 [Kribbella antibiotica]
MRRTLTAVCTLVLLLTACQAEKKPEPTPVVATGNLCERMLPKLAGQWKVAPAGPSGAVPLTDSCRLIDTEAPQHMIRVSLSVLPVSAADAVRLRKQEEADNRRDHVATKLMDGDLGEGSWTLDPVAAAPQLGFRTGDRLVLLRGDTEYGASYRSDRSTLAELQEMAKVITELPNGLPTDPAAIDEPGCAPGAAAAAKILGAKAVIRRGGTMDGYLYCQWGSVTDTILVRGGGQGSDQAFTFADYPNSSARAVKVGDEGWLQTDGIYLAFRVGNAYVAGYTTRKNSGPALVELGRAMTPSYRR